MAALAEHPRAVGVFELDEWWSKISPSSVPGADLRAAHAVGFDRMRAFEPVDDVDVVDVLLDDVVAAEPGEVVPVRIWYSISVMSRLLSIRQTSSRECFQGRSPFQ